MRGAEFAELAAFVAIAENGSFGKAAAIFGVSTSALSKTLRTLEERLGVRLFNRTTRSVALTEAGQQLLAQVKPALGELSAAVESINAFRDTPAGTLRLNVSSLAGAMVIGPILGQFAAAYPAIMLDVSVTDGPIDIVGDRFDAGIRNHKRIERDMIALRISRVSQMVAVASAEYLAGHPAPETPQDLAAHNCIRFRRADGTIGKWEFEKGGGKKVIRVEGSLIVDNVDLMLQAVLQGVGVAYFLEAYVRPYIADGRLVPILEDWSPRFSGWHIYFPSRRQMRTPLKAFMEFIRDAIPPV